MILGDHFDQLIKAELKTGRYSSTSEVIRAALRLLEQEMAKIDAINQALVVGENSGKPKKFDNEKFKVKMKKSFGKDARN